MENENLKKKKILYVLTKIPYPALDGTRERILIELKHLSLDFNVSVLIITTETLTPETERVLRDILSGELIFFRLAKIHCYLRAFLSIVSKLPMQVAYFNSRKIRHWFKSNSTSYDIIHLHTIRLGEYARSLKLKYKNRKTTTLMCLNDAISLNYSSATTKAKGLWQLIYGLELSKVTRYELEMLKICDGASIVSDNDRKFIENNWHKVYKNSKVPEITLIRNGVSEELFSYNYVGKTKNLVFLGNLLYPPNIQGLRNFCKKIMPLITKSSPETKLLVIGRGGESIKDKFSQVEFLGFVKDPYEIICEQALFINPASFGAGVPSKVILAMALGIPVVSTINNIEGMEGIKDKENIYLLDQDNQKSAKVILSLLEDKTKMQNIGIAGKKLALEKYTFLENYSNLKRFILS